MSIKDEIRAEIMKSGAIAVGFAKAADVNGEATRQYGEWIASGRHAGMEYLSRHAPLKRHPDSVMENTATVICTAFSYAPLRFRDDSLPAIACYAYGEDYHDVIRKRLSTAVGNLKEQLGGDWRICIDSAPLAERYWAMESGIGKRGKNGSIIVDRCGSWCFLAEILTSLPVAPDEAREASCIGCGECIRRCPTRALSADGTIDSAKCLNYLTIEHRGEWTGDMASAMATDAGRHTLFGCDICQRVCPHNRDVEPTGIPEFQSSQKIMELEASAVAGMTQEAFSKFFKGSPIKRAKLDGMKRNALNCLKNQEK